MDSSSQHEPIHRDIEFEILIRTSLQAMDKCKTVKKEWKKLIYDRAFMASYNKNSNNFIGYLPQHLSFPPPSKSLIFVSPDKEETIPLPSNLIDKLKIEASSPQGILCCSTKVNSNNYRYYIGKPFTNQWQPIPNPKLRYRTRKVALVILSSNPLRYKIIRISSRDLLTPFGRHRCEIFDSEFWIWKQVEDLMLAEWWNYLVLNVPAVHASGLACMLVCSNVLAFNVDRETHFAIPFPHPSIDASLQPVSISEYQGKLALMTASPITWSPVERTIEVWLLIDPENRRWQILKRFNLDWFEFHMAFPISLYSDEILVMKIHSGLLLLKLQDLSYDRINLTFGAQEIFYFRSDREAVNLKPVKNVEEQASKVN